MLPLKHTNGKILLYSPTFTSNDLTKPVAELKRNKDFEQLLDNYDKTIRIYESTGTTIDCPICNSTGIYYSIRLVQDTICPSKNCLYRKIILDSKIDVPLAIKQGILPFKRNQIEKTVDLDSNTIVDLDVVTHTISKELDNAYKSINDCYAIPPTYDYAFWTSTMVSRETVQTYAITNGGMDVKKTKTEFDDSYNAVMAAMESIYLHVTSGKVLNCSLMLSLPTNMYLYKFAYAVIKTARGKGLTAMPVLTSPELARLVKDARSTDDKSYSYEADRLAAKQVKQDNSRLDAYLDSDIVFLDLHFDKHDNHVNSLVSFIWDRASRGKCTYVISQAPMYKFATDFKLKQLVNYALEPDELSRLLLFNLTYTMLPNRGSVIYTEFHKYTNPLKTLKQAVSKL